MCVSPSFCTLQDAYFLTALMQAKCSSIARLCVHYRDAYSVRAWHFFLNVFFFLSLSCSFTCKSQKLPHFCALLAVAHSLPFHSLSPLRQSIAFGNLLGIKLIKRRNEGRKNVVVAGEHVHGFESTSVFLSSTPHHHPATSN